MLAGDGLCSCGILAFGGLPGSGMHVLLLTAGVLGTWMWMIS